MKRQIILHPILFVLWAFAFMYVHNAEQMFFRDVAVTLVVGVGAALALWGLIYLLLRNWRKAAIITSFIVVTFFSYERISTPIDLLGSAPKLLLWMGLVVGLIVIIARSRRHFDQATVLLNLVALVLLGTVVGLWWNYRLSLAPGPVAQVERFIAAWQIDSTQFDTTACNAARSMPRPNIYYIILDGFGRADVLQDLYQIDDPNWIDGLQQLGFYIADQSTSNYGQTALSLASSLNLTYLDEVASQIDPVSANRLPLKVMLEESRVIQFLRCAGYRIVYFPTGFVFVDLTTGVDEIMAPSGSLTAYQNELFRTTPLFALSAALFRKTEHDFYRERILYIFEHLKDAAQSNGPVFVMAHVLAPHPPFVFGPNGESVQTEDQRLLLLNDGSWFTARNGREVYVNRYREQARFIAQQAQQAIAEILEHATRPTLIIVQGDHGPGSMVDWNSPENTNFRERMTILNAFYFPDRDYAALYPGITPVNAFRVVFNQYLGAQYELLEDRNYFSVMDHPYALLDVTEEAQAEP